MPAIQNFFDGAQLFDGEVVWPVFGRAADPPGQRIGHA
jgi:hypothetical protein